MKTVFIAALMFPLFSFGQVFLGGQGAKPVIHGSSVMDVQWREYFDSTSKYTYLIKYFINGWASQPAVVGAAIHFGADIQVYRLQWSAATAGINLTKPKTDTIPIGQPFRGTYVPGGCFEDVPADWVKRALSK